MNNVEFTRLFRNPELLLQADFAELEQLAARYPYAASTHLLLALRAELSGHPRRDVYLSRAAASTFDRSHLYDLFQELTQPTPLPTPEAPAEEELELISLENLTPPAVLLSSETNPAPAAAPDWPADLTSAAAAELPDYDYEDSLPDFFNDEVTAEPEPEPILSSSPEPAAEPHTETPAPEENILPQPAAGTTPATPEDPTKFGPRRPINSKEELRRRLAVIRQRQVEQEETSKTKVRKVARRSLVNSDGLISPTLAQVFISQGQYQHAIRIYEQLALANPEKRPTFASLIQNLKRKL